MSVTIQHESILLAIHVDDVPALGTVEYMAALVLAHLAAD
jgi:hypothetical protein